MGYRPGMMAAMEAVIASHVRMVGRLLVCCLDIQSKRVQFLINGKRMRFGLL